MKPEDRYLRDCEGTDFIKDPVQFQTVKLLQQLYNDLCELHKTSLLARFRKKSGLTKTPKGFYLWGEVGRGKTYLMDLFCDSLKSHAIAEDSNIAVRRIHFYRFMYWLQQQLKDNSGAVNPLNKIACDLAREINVLCFDEFFVAEIGDAMLLGRLFETLFAKGVVLIATSNIPPEKLYWKGLHRARFLPTIELLKNACQVIELDGERDYRLRTLKKVDIYYFPNDKQADRQLLDCFKKLAGGEQALEGKQAEHVIIFNREIPLKALSANMIWFEFSALCEGPRSAKDYIEISRLYPTVLISNVPQLDDQSIAQVRRFIALIDEFYERQVKVIISAAVSIQQLYQGSRLHFEFQRTVSRLEEMQSEKYLGLAHLQ